MPKYTTPMGTVDGVTTEVTTEDGDGTIHITKKQDVQPTLDYAKFLREQPVNRKALDRKVAEIPPILASELLRKGILQDTKRLLKWLDRPENKPFRTWEGRLS
jgi:hypothetical protein